MIDAFLFVGLPYIAVAALVVAGYWRARQAGYTFSSRSSQFLEDKALLWGSGPWHVGIIVVLLGHLAAAFFPGVWSWALTLPGALITVEAIGFAGGLLALIGLCTLIARRITSSRVQAVTTVMDLIVVGLLLAQIGFGLYSAVALRYGSAWAAGTVVPYVWSLLKLQPQMAYVADMPMVFKVHVALAWVLLLLLPFTRLMHLLAVPLPYIWRAPQLVVWNNARRRQQPTEITLKAESRREFLKAATGLAGGAGLIAIGVTGQTARFLKGPEDNLEAKAELLEKKLQRLQLTAEQRELELERQRRDIILVARYSELVENKGKYFIDYQMAPGLAFKGKDGLPLLISAKCTHLGCTVGSEMDAQGRVLCPCHISYFDVLTGKPNDGAPAKLPLKPLAWALLDAAGKTVLSKAAGQPVQGNATPALLAQCSLYITKPSPTQA